MIRKMIISLFGFIIFIVFLSCNKSETKIENQNPQIKENSQSQSEKNQESKQSNETFRIEFVELGSVNCIPCKKMQPIMASIEKKYGGQVKVTFYDVWKDPAPAKKFGITLIPTQVFLDNNGNELMRHEGFFPEEEIDKFLQSKGLRIVN